MKPSGGVVPLHEPVFEGNEWRYLKECIDTAWVSSGGEFVIRFEAMLARWTGRKCAVAVVNGTAALQLSLEAIGVRRGDEVLVPSLTFIAPLNCVAHRGAIPVFIDAEEATFGMNPSLVAGFLATHAEIRDDGFAYDRGTSRRIAACVPVHVFGHPVRMTELCRICDEWRIPIVEDASESLGSTYQARSTGAFGRIGCFSFNGNKIVTAGGGGMVVTDDELLAERVRHISTQAKRDPWAYWHDAVGYNYRLPNINAALGCAQMERLDAFLEKKRELATWYREAFFSVPGVTVAWEPEGAKSNFWLNTLKAETAARAEAIHRAAASIGYVCRPPWAPGHLQGLFEPRDAGPLPVTERLWRSSVNVPSGVKVGREDVERLAQALRSN